MANLSMQTSFHDESRKREQQARRISEEKVKKKQAKWGMKTVWNQVLQAGHDYGMVSAMWGKASPTFLKAEDVNL